MRKAIWTVLILLSVGVLFLVFGLTPLRVYLNLSGRAGVSIQTNLPASVLIDGQSMGATPFKTESLSAGEHLVKLSSDQGVWSGYVNTPGGTLAIVDRDLALTNASSAGEVMTLGPGSGLEVVSNPSSAEVDIDNTPAGQTPFRLDQETPGEYLFTVRKDGYITRSFRATIKEGLALTLQVDLALFQPDQTILPTPVPLALQMLMVTSTPTGFLRVREAPSLDSREVEEIHPRDRVQLVQDLGVWDKVKLPDGKEGYASSQYLRKI